jgi:hypothetical protein
LSGLASACRSRGSSSSGLTIVHSVGNSIFGRTAVALPFGSNPPGTRTKRLSKELRCGTTGFRRKKFRTFR